MLGGQPWDISFSPDGTLLYVSYFNDNTVKILSLDGSQNL